MICVMENRGEGAVEVSKERKKTTREAYMKARHLAMDRVAGDDTIGEDCATAEILEGWGYIPPSGLRRERPAKAGQEPVAQVPGWKSKVPFKSWTPVPDVWLREYRQYFPMAVKGSPTEYLMYHIQGSKGKGYDGWVCSYRQIRRELGFSNGYIAKLNWMFKECGILAIREAGWGSKAIKQKSDLAYKVLPEEYWKLDQAKVIQELWSIREKNRKRQKGK